MRTWIVNILLGGLLIGALIYFFSAGLSESDGYKKLRLETKKNGFGFVIRMKPTGWEVWKVESKVETALIYPAKKEIAKV